MQPFWSIILVLVALGLIGASVNKGFRLSLLLAIGIGAAGGVFEALVLLPLSGFVTLTLGPDIVFLVTNTVCLARCKDREVRIGIAWGYLNVLLTVVVSFVCFMMLADIQLTP